MIFAAPSATVDKGSPVGMQIANSTRHSPSKIITISRTLVSRLIYGFVDGMPREQNMDVATDTSEFRYLPAQADALGVPLPRVERLSTAGC